MYPTQQELEEKFGYHFNNPKLLDKALTHKSYSVERNINFHNEILEFLGDSIIGFIVSEYLVKRYPDKDEGFLSKMKSHIVSSENLYKWASHFGVEKYVKVATVNTLDPRAKKQIVANSFEAIIGAMYLDRGIERVKTILFDLLETKTDLLSFADYKSKLQEYCQKKYKILPIYKLISQEGPEHQKKFQVALYIKDEKISTGEGRSKKEAEQNAAKNAINKLRL